MDDNIKLSLSKIREHSDNISYGYYMSLLRILEKIAEDLDTLTASRRSVVVYDSKQPGSIMQRVQKPLNILEDDLEVE